MARSPAARNRSTSGLRTADRPGGALPITVSSASAHETARADAAPPRRACGSGAYRKLTVRLHPVGDDVAGDAAFDRRDADDLAEDQAVDRRRPRTGGPRSARARRSPRGSRCGPATAARRAPRRRAPRSAALRLPRQPTSIALAVGSITIARSIDASAGHRSNSGRSALWVIGSSSRPQNRNPTSRSDCARLPREPRRDLEHHGQRRPSCRRRLARRSRPPRARRGSSRSAERYRRVRRARPAGTPSRRADGIAKRTESSRSITSRLSGTAAPIAARIAASSPLTDAMFTRSSVRAASRPSNPGSRWLAEPVTRGRGPADGQGRPRPRRPARPRRSGAPPRSRRRSTSSAPPGNRTTVVAGDQPGLVRRHGDGARAAAARHGLARAPLPHACLDPVLRARGRTRRSSPRGTTRGVRARGRCARRGTDRDRPRRTARDAGCPSRPRSPSASMPPPTSNGCPRNVSHAGPRIGIAAFVKPGTPISTVTRCTSPPSSCSPAAGRRLGSRPRTRPRPTAPGRTRACPRTGSRCRTSRRGCRRRCGSP